MKRAWILALVLVTAGLAGCIGDTDEASQTEEETTNCDEGEINEGRNGRISPTSSMTFEAEVTGEPATAEISIDAEGTGGFTVSLERDGEEVWREEFDGTGDQGGDYYPNPLSAGDYTLTASSETGTYDISLSWTLTWSEGC